MDFFFSKLLWFKPYNTFLYTEGKKRARLRRIRVRFFKPVTAYLATFDNTSIIFNLFYKTTLERFQAMDAKKEEESEDLIPAMRNQQGVDALFYR